MSVITQDQYNVVKQKYRRILVKLDILNFNFQVVGSVEGNLTTGNIQINANSDIRRTCNISLVIKKHTIRIEPGGQIWLDKYIKIYYGIINNSNGETVWTNMGVYLINNPNHVYDAVNNTITFSGVDLMAKISGLRNGYYEWLNGVIPKQTLEYGNPVATLSNNDTYSCTIPSLSYTEEPPVGVNIGFGVTQGNTERISYLKINNFRRYSLFQDGVAFSPPQPKPGTTDYYIVKFVRNERYPEYSHYDIIGLQGNVRDVFVDLLKQAGIEQFNIEEITYTNGETVKLPYDIEISASSSLYDVFKSIRDNIIPNYEMFFDENGVFNLKKIQNNASDPIIIDNNIFDKTIMSISNNIDFENVKNAIEIWGQELSAEYNCIYLRTEPIYLEIEYQHYLIGFRHVVFCGALKSFQSIPENVYISVPLSTIYLGTGLQQFLKIIVEGSGSSAVGFQEYPLVQGNTWAYEKSDGNTYNYIVTFDSTKFFYQEPGVFNLITRQDVHAYIEDTNPESPFYVNGSIGKILLPLSGGEYDNLQTYQQAKDRAEWEFYNYCRMNDTITLTSVVIPWADVNQKIEFINEDSEISGIFIIKTISMDLSVDGTMTMECMRWYDYDPWDNQ